MSINYHVSSDTLNAVHSFNFTHWSGIDSSTRQRLPVLWYGPRHLLHILVQVLPEKLLKSSPMTFYQKT